MNLFNLFTMVGGLAFFLYGMHLLGEGLSKLSGGKMEAILTRMTSHPLKGVVLGAGATAIIQSSSATTVMVVGFVNSGIMQLRQAVGIIMGANIGTTITSWFLSLTGIESDNFFIMLLKPTSFSPILAIVGVFLLMFGKSGQKKDVGGILLGFSILMFGMDTMSSAMKPLKDVPQFTNLFVAFSNPLMGMIAGTLLTAVIQSSSASVGILQALCATGAIPYSAVLPIIMGQNIGTCITALISSVGANVNAKRAAFIHLYFNVIGTAVFMFGFYAVNFFAPFSFLEQAATPAGIALVHSCFNILATVVLLPFSNRLVELARASVPERDGADSHALPARMAALSNMDRRFLDNPSLALSQCRKTAGAMLTLAGEAAGESLGLLSQFSEKSVCDVSDLEGFVNQYEEKIGDYILQISRNALSEADSRELSLIQHSVGHIERIANYALEITKSVHKMNKKELAFSQEAKEELDSYGGLVLTQVKHTMDYWDHPIPITANDARQLENERRRMEKRVLKNHRKRVKKGKCSVTVGFLLSDILSGLGKISEHSLQVMDAVQYAIPGQISPDPEMPHLP